MGRHQISFSPFSLSLSPFTVDLELVAWRLLVLVKVLIVIVLEVIDGDAVIAALAGLKELDHVLELALAYKEEIQPLIECTTKISKIVTIKVIVLQETLTSVVDNLVGVLLEELEGGESLHVDLLHLVGRRNGARYRGGGSGR